MVRIIVITVVYLVYAIMFVGILAAFWFIPKQQTVCTERLLVERRFGFDYPVNEYSEVKNLPTYVGLYCENVTPTT